MDTSKHEGAITTIDPAAELAREIKAAERRLNDLLVRAPSLGVTVQVDPLRFRRDNVLANPPQIHLTLTKAL